MARVLEAYNEGHPSDMAISPSASTATLERLRDARRHAVAASEPSPAEVVAQRRTQPSGTAMERAMQLRAARATGSAALRQLNEAAERDAQRDDAYAAHPQRYDACRELLRRCHQTPNHGSIACHHDICAPGLESKHCVVTGQAATSVPVVLRPSGSLQRPPQSAVVYPIQGMASLLSGPGPNEPVDEFELHDCRIPQALHGSIASLNRGVYVRPASAVYVGTVICDHSDMEKGTREWHDYNVQHRSMTARESREAARMVGGLNTWWAQNPGRRM